MSDGPFGRRAPDPGEPAPPPLPPPPPPARLTAQGAWIAGVLAVLILGYIALNSIRTEGPGGRGIGVGDPLPVFAMPLATSNIDADSNIAEKPGEGARNAACDVRGPGILNSCQMVEQGPVVLVFFAEPSEDCKRQVDALDRVSRRFPDVQVAAISIRGSREKVRKAIRERGWKLPVGYDRDGAVANAYAVGVCPTLTFSRRGGKVSQTSFRLLEEKELERRLRELG